MIIKSSTALRNDYGMISDLAHKEAKVDKAIVEPLAHVLGVAAVQGKAHQRIVVLHLGDHVSDKPYRRRFAATDAHLARERLGRYAQLRLRASHQVDNLLRAPAQAHARRGELDAATATVKELEAELLFQVLHLARERGLG